jgi:hypothetical protein
MRGIAAAEPRPVLGAGLNGPGSMRRGDATPMALRTAGWRAGGAGGGGSTRMPSLGRAMPSCTPTCQDHALADLHAAEPSAATTNPPHTARYRSSTAARDRHVQLRIHWPSAADVCFPPPTAGTGFPARPLQLTWPPPCTPCSSRFGSYRCWAPCARAIAVLSAATESTIRKHPPSLQAPTMAA